MMTFKRLGEGERILGTLLVAGLLVAACDSTHFGTGPGGASGLGGSGTGPAFDPGDAGFPGDVMGLGAAQSWTGYIENYHFASGSDAVKLSFAVGSDGVVAGTLTLGAGSPPPPATDPDAIYPPGPRQISPSSVVEGFPYTMAGGTLTGSRLQFAIWPAEVWTGWCALQMLLPGDRWCVIDGTYEENADGTACDHIEPNGQRVPVSCAKLDLCSSNICTCNDAGCVVSFTFGNRINFDISLMPAMASGSVGGIGGEIFNVRLTQDP